MEITTTNLNEIRALANAELKAAVEATNVADRAMHFDNVDQAIGAYTAVAKKQAYDAAKASGDPLKYACNEFFYGVIRLKQVKDKESNMVLFSIEDADKRFDLADMHKKLGGIGKDTNWLYTAEKFNYHLTIRAMKEMNNEGKLKIDNFRMKEISRSIDLGKDPTSNTQLLKTLQTLIDQMIGPDYHALNHDVKYLLSVYTTDDKRSKTAVKAANHKELRSYLMKVCHRILNNLTSYDVLQKEVQA